MAYASGVAPYPNNWRLLDIGEDRLRKLFPATTVHTTLRNRTAVITLWAYHPNRAYMQFEEPVEDFPSDHLIAQIMLVVG